MTNVVKGAGRARYQANRKHQQNTPLPPRKAAAEPTVGARRRSVIAEAAEAAQPIKRAPRPRVAKPTAEAPAAKVSPTKAAPAKRAPDKVAAPTVAPPAAKASKAQQFALAAEEAGWKVERIVKGSRKTVLATRGEETIDCNWENDRSMTPLGSHIVAGHVEKFKHVTVAIKKLSVPAEVAASSIKPAKVDRAEKGTRRVQMVVPFSPKESSDNEVLAALRGHTVKWTNHFTDIEESAVVPANGRQTKLELDDLDDLATRQLTFCDATGEGYRTLRLSDVVFVSAGIKDVG